MKVIILFFFLTITRGQYLNNYDSKNKNNQNYNYNTNSNNFDNFYPNLDPSVLSPNRSVNAVNTGVNRNNTLVFCTTSKAEFAKCNAFSVAVDREIGQFGRHYVAVSCYAASKKEECMTLLDYETVHLTTLDAGEVFIAGRYHSLVPIMQEVDLNRLQIQYAVAVIKKGSLSDVSSLHDLRGKKACFAGTETLAGWIIPLHTLMKHGGLEVIDCNNHVKSTINYFGPSCAVNSLVDRYNPLGDNSDQLCKLCIGEIPGGRCTNADPYAGYEGAFRCLIEAGEIAFLLHSTIDEVLTSNFNYNSVKKSDFELLCPDGSRSDIDNYRNCHWDQVPTRAIVVSSALKLETRRLYQKFFEKAAKLFSKGFVANATRAGDNLSNRNDRFDNRFNINNYNNEGYGVFGNETNRGFRDENREQVNSNSNYDANSNSNWDDPLAVRPLEVFDLFESAPKFGNTHNLLFSDSARDFISLPEKDQTYASYLGKKSEDAILGVRSCPIERMKLCVTSKPEIDKCVKMKVAMKAQLLKPELDCVLQHSQIKCMQAIENGIADVAVLDAGDVYTAGLMYNLVPFMSEVYNLPTPEYYVVAVAKENDPSTDITYLKNKYTCHTGINTAAGWIYPLAYMISNQWIRGYGCDSIRAAAEYFTKSCVPGALSTEYNIGVPYDNMCDLCHGLSSHYCRRDATEDYFGHTGALRCLVEGGGEVAFVKHTTVFENTDGKRKEFWARNTFTKDFELLCPDGTRKSTLEYETCNLGKVKSNAIVARGGEYGFNHTEINAYINLFVYAQQFYGRKEADEFSFSMFSSIPPYTDLIFQDATQQLVIIPSEMREFSRYLGPDFMRARRIVDCAAGASTIEYSILALLSVGVALLLSR
ncbi:melanotransferrin [Microplitis demolitor]|uniref:melanotransferrin n=1 Tax=Microplitis demolitor TaxID=69319 RepID=UPI00235B655A|nr:melanotransferrin [Microplitis demolitor]